MKTYKVRFFGAKKTTDGTDPLAFRWIEFETAEKGRGEALNELVRGYEYTPGTQTCSLSGTPWAWHIEAGELVARPFYGSTLFGGLLVLDGVAMEPVAPSTLGWEYRTTHGSGSRWILPQATLDALKLKPAAQAAAFAFASLASA